MALVLLTLGTLLLLNGFVHGDVGHASTGPTPKKAAHPKGAGLAGAGPVLDLRGQTVRSSSADPHDIALTFDDGPDPKWTPQILDILRDQHVPATFFVVGARASEHPSLVRRELAEGHEIGLHTFTHADLGNIPRWRANLEVSLDQQVIAGITGHTTVLLRPPYSSTPDALAGKELDAARRMARAGYLIVLADIDPRDWARPGLGAIERHAIPAAGHGAVMLMHDAGGNRAETVAAVRALIPWLRALGYRFVPLSTVVGQPPSQLMAKAGTFERFRGRLLLIAIQFADWLDRVVRWALLALVGLSLLRVGVGVALARRHARRSRERAAAPQPELPGVSVVVPAYNEEVGIAATVRSLLASGHPDIEVIIVDDGSTDATSERAIEAAAGDPRVRVLRRDNGGKPAAINTGTAAAVNDLIVLMDGDTIFEPGTIRRLVVPLLADPTIGAVSGNTKVGNRRGLLSRWQHLEYVFGFNLDRRMFDLLGCITTVPGAIGAFRRQALDAVGGVSDDTLAEDTDLTMALVRAGWRVVYQDDAVAWTEVPATLGSLWRQRYRWSYGTMQAMWKHRRAWRERGPLGRLALPWMLVFQILLPVLAPVVDVWAIYGLVFGDAATALAVWFGLTALGLLVGVYALRLDHERLRDLWALPLQQFVYRQLMYLVVIQSLVAAVQGQRLRWHKLRRRGITAPTLTHAE